MTCSIIARDPDTGELGLAVQSRFFAVGRWVAHAEAGVGIVATQAFADPALGPEGIRLLRAGQDAPDVLRKLVGTGAGSATGHLLQIAVLNANGSVAVHTGTSCIAAAGHLLGRQCAAQGNMMLGPSVWPAMVQTFEQTPGALADRMLSAMKAAERQGGDLRGKQAAALIVVSGKQSTSGDGGRIFDLRIDDDPDPVGKIGRQLVYARAHRRAGEALARVMAGDPAGALEDLDACCEAFPEEPDFLTRRALVLMALGQVTEAREMMRRACTVHPGWAEFVRRFAEAGIVPMRPELLLSLVDGPA